MSYSTPASDYAEMFEWEDGNPENEDRVGYFVTLKKGIAAIPPPLASRKRSPYRIKMILPKQY